MINQNKPTTSYTNISKVSIGETWATIDTTWLTETRTWIAVSKLITNIASVGKEFLATEALDYLMTEDDDYLVTGVGLITNQAKP